MVVYNKSASLVMKLVVQVNDDDDGNWANFKARRDPGQDPGIDPDELGSWGNAVDQHL